MRDPQKKLDAIMYRLGCGWGQFKQLFGHEYYQQTIRDPMASRMQEAPFGWHWARELHPKHSKDLHVVAASDHLWSWAYMFLDRDRLEEWGTVCGGKLVYDPENGICYSGSGRKIIYRPRPDTWRIWRH